MKPEFLQKEQYDPNKLKTYATYSSPEEVTIYVLTGRLGQQENILHDFHSNLEFDECYLPAISPWPYYTDVFLLYQNLMSVYQADIFPKKLE